MKLIRILIIWSFVSFGYFFSSASLAREWYFQPSASVQTLYDTNQRLLSDQAKATGNTNTDAFGFLTYANANFGVRSDNYDIGINATGVIKRYISDLDLNNDNVYVTAKSAFKVTERNTFGLIGRFADETVLNKVIDTTDTAQQNVQRTTLFINPDWTYALSDLTSVRLDYKHSNVSYDKIEEALSQPGSRRFFDNTANSASISLMHDWTASMKSHASFEALIFDVPDLNQTTNNYNFNIGIDYIFSETWTASAEGGFYNVDTEINETGLTLSDESTGPLFLFKTQKIFETSKIDAGYFRRTSTRGRGGLALVDTSYFVFTQKLSDRFQVALKGSYNDIRNISDIGTLNSLGSNDYTFYAAGASASWLISPQFDLTGSYQYRFRESQQDSANNADSNAFFLTFNYKWDPFSTREF